MIAAWRVIRAACGWRLDSTGGAGRSCHSRSPLPSPQGRGRTFVCASVRPVRQACSKDRLRGSLSPRERAGVGGNRAYSNRTCRIFTGAGKLRVSFTAAGVHKEGL